MTEHLDEQIARTMEVDVRLLSLLPELVADLEELGTSSAPIVAALAGAGLGPGAALLDLGCGKGAVAVALAQRLGVRVEGIDAFPPFVEAARALAEAQGVGRACDFRVGDIREMLGRTGDYDAALLISVGAVAGSLRETVGGLRTLVRPGGIFVFEDGFLAEGVAPGPECDGYLGHSATLSGLVAFGDVLLQEVVSSPEETRSLNERNTACIARRARSLARRHPELAGVLDEYVARQERETEILGREVPCATWVLRRV